MSLSTWFGFSTSTSSDELPDIFPLTYLKDDFIRTDLNNIYSKILTDVIERSSGLKEEQHSLLWDSCLKSESAEGLITMLSKAMTDKKDLFIVYDKEVKVIRHATAQEKKQIEEDYKKNAQSKTGVFISFQNYNRSDMLKLYSALEYCTIGALNKQLNLSKALQFKMKSLRSSVSLADSEEAKKQAQKIAKGLGEGKDALMDSEDIIDITKTDLTATKESLLFLNEKRSFYLGLPASYIMGEQTGGLGTTGENDTKAIERGLKNYFVSIIKPVLDELFTINLGYKSQDFRQINQALEAMKTFDLVGEDYLTWENKKKIVEGLLDIEEADNKAVQEEFTPVLTTNIKTGFN